MSLTPIVCCACLAIDHIELSTVIMLCLVSPVSSCDLGAISLPFTVTDDCMTTTFLPRDSETNKSRRCLAD